MKTTSPFESVVSVGMEKFPPLSDDAVMVAFEIGAVSEVTWTVIVDTASEIIIAGSAVTSTTRILGSTVIVP